MVRGLLCESVGRPCTTGYCSLRIACFHTSIQSLSYEFIYLSVHQFVNLYMHPCMNLCIHPCKHLCIHSCTNLCIQPCIHSKAYSGPCQFENSFQFKPETHWKKSSFSHYDILHLLALRFYFNSFKIKF